MGMFCYQCEQTAKGTGCTVLGVCGKDATVATLQDILVYVTEGIAMYAKRAEDLGATDREIDLFVIEALFTTVTNVDFDADHIKGIIDEAVKVRARAKSLYEAAASKDGKTAESLDGPASFMPASNLADLVQQGEALSIPARRATQGEEITSLQDLILYGLKGAAAYADHAQILGKASEDVFSGFRKYLDLLTKPSPSIDELLGAALGVGELNMKAMGLLDAANTEAYGTPVPTQVRVTPVKGKAILVSGHDLKDLETLLKQTEGKGINIYTHGEMLPAHAYPKLKAYKHLVGNYGGAWQDQQKEFDQFPGAVLMTTNCIQKPRESYLARIFTTGLVEWPGAVHVDNKDFTPVIEAALAAPGFAEDEPEQSIVVGFAANAVLGVADKVIDAVKSGAIKHFFLIGGCDGAKSGRNYYTEFAQAVPDDSVILTLACGKYRFNKLDFGNIGGIPRLLDVGQCNDAYSAVQIALALANAFECGVNDLPLSIVCSWYEQKAVAILLSLLHLGIKDIRLGPSLPAFVTPTALNILVENFGIKPISTPDEDLKAILA
jgi:hydroxylamine reductase